MTTQHTPAPWLHGEHGDGAAITDAAGHRIASLAYGKQSVSMTIPVEQSLANARLIVAAPELLGAGIEALDFLQRLLNATSADEAHDFIVNNGSTVEDMLTAAITKARGDT